LEACLTAWREVRRRAYGCRSAVCRVAVGCSVRLRRGLRSGGDGAGVAGAECSGAVLSALGAHPGRRSCQSFGALCLGASVWVVATCFSACWGAGRWGCISEGVLNGHLVAVFVERNRKSLILSQSIGLGGSFCGFPRVSHAFETISVFSA
jgi:hypothetical protein